MDSCGSKSGLDWTRAQLDWNVNVLKHSTQPFRVVPLSRTMEANQRQNSVTNWNVIHMQRKNYTPYTQNDQTKTGRRHTFKQVQLWFHTLKHPLWGFFPLCERIYDKSATFPADLPGSTYVLQIHVIHLKYKPNKFCFLMLTLTLACTSPTLCYTSLNKKAFKKRGKVMFL